MKGNYRDILKTCLKRRLEVRPQYSLRAFARDIGVSPGALSSILKGRYGLSPEKARQVALRLNLNEAEQRSFQILVESEYSRNPILRKSAKAKLKEGIFIQYSYMDTKWLEILSNWYYLAILELTYLPDFSSKVEWIAQRLGIHVSLASDAWDRLRKMKLVMRIRGHWVDVHQKLATPDGVPSSIIREMHRSLLTRAIEALELQTISERDSSAMIVAIDLALLPEAKQKLREFRRQFTKWLRESSSQNGHSPNQVYALSLQLFNLTPNFKALSHADTRKEVS